MAADRDASELEYEELAGSASEIRARLDRFRTALGAHFVGRQPVVDLLTVCAIAQEPLLLVGPPGTAKSELVTKFRDALGVPQAEYFEYMLTRFTEPSEILGPIDVSLLREGHYLRRAEGMLPTARMAFLDEIFKSNSAILNSLLTIINERKFYQDGQPVPVKLAVLVAATNEVPDHEDLAALEDRFCLKALCEPVQDDHFVDLVDLGLASQTARDLGRRPWAEGHATLDDLLQANRWLTLQMARVETGARGQPVRDRDRYFDAEVMAEFRRIVRTLVREDDVFVSDRKIVKLYKLIRARAWLMHGGHVEREDLIVLQFLGRTRDELRHLQDKVPRLLGFS